MSDDLGVYTPLSAMEDAKTSVVAQLAGGTVAAITDLGTSMYNSIVPEKMEVSTRDMLARISGDALKVYEEHPDAVQAASFIGGVFMPVGLSLKGVNAIRSGMKGANWFSEAGKTAQMTKVHQLIQEGKYASAEYNSAIRGLYARNIANTVVDNAAAEVAILFTMNAHPYMEDYVKDPMHSFATSMMLGTAITAPFAHIAARADVKQLGIKAYTEAIDPILRAKQGVELTADYSVQLAQHQTNIDNWANLIKGPEVGPQPRYSELTKQLAESFVQSAKVAQVETFDKMASAEILALPNELKLGIMQKIASDPERFAGINKIGYATAKEETSFLKSAYDKLVNATETVTGIPLTKQKVNKAGVTETVTDDMVYSPTFDSFMKRSDLSGYGVAADLVSSEKELTSGVSKNWHLIPNYDADLQVLSETSAKIDLDYLQKLKLVDEMPAEKLSEMAIHPSDGATLNALVARLQKMQAEGIDISDFKVTLTEHKPRWDKIEEGMLQQEISRVSAQGAGGVKATYLQDITTNIEGKFDDFLLLDATGKVRPQTSPAVQKLLTGWMSGSGMTTLRKAIDDAFRPSQYAKHGLDASLVKAAREIYDSPQSVALRNTFMQQADSEGYVYLYRGLRRDSFSSATLESFTTNAAKAAQFGTPKLYRVKVQDIYAGILDIPGGLQRSKSTEILVMSHTREGLEKLPIAELKEALPDSFKSLTTFGIDPANYKGVHKTNMNNLVANSYDDFLATNPIKAEATAEELASHQAQAQAYIKAELDSYIKDVNDFAALKTANIDKLNTQATFTDVLHALNKTKINDVTTMAAMGTPVETISLRTNIPIESVQRLLMGEDIANVNSRMYGSADVIGQYIKPELKSLQVGTTLDKIPVASMRANIHKQMLDETDSAIKLTLLMESKSSTLKELAEFLYNKDNVARMGMLKSALVNIVDPAIGSRFLQSADFALRDMGDAGYIIAAIGKESTHLYNKFTDKLLKPISNAFASIAKDQAGIIEFNTAKELNASIKGYREFRVDTDGLGRFYKQDETNPWKTLPTGEKIRNMVPAQWKNQDFAISTPSVISAYQEMALAGREMYAINDSYRKILGQQSITDLGFWMPAVNPRNKFISYVIDHVDGSTKMLYANTADELKSAENAYAGMMTNRSPGTWQIVRKGEDQQLFNIIQGRHDPMFTTVADVTALHGGSSASAVVSTNMNSFSELANAYEHYMHRSIANHLELQYSDVMAHLDNLSVNARSVIKGQPISDIQKALNKVDDAGLAAKNILLGRNDLKEYVGWQNIQNGIQTTVEIALQNITKFLDPIINPAKGVFGKGKSLSDAEWEKVVDDMEVRGIPNPFKDLDDAVAKERFHVDKISLAPNMTARVVALSNNLAATALLKVMELGQPLVNMLSLPILTSAAVQKQFQTEFMGATLKPGFHLSTTRAMYDGVRYLGHPEYAKYKAIAQDLGVLTPVVSEVNELLQMTRSFNPGIMQKVENALNSNLVNILSRPAEWSEKAVREMAFATGVSLAKKAYPGLGDSGVVTFARNFVDTAIGNYNAAQRPALFQGTIGTAMGLFQTYMVTLMQQMYRKAELRDYKNLAKMALTQSTIFGVKSLPGFNQVSEMIGEHFSDANIDLTTGMYRAVPEGVADLVLYGLPSNLGPAVYSRGDIQPRVPNILGGVQNLAAVNIATQAVEAASNLAKATKQLGDEGATMAFFEALSVQSVSRPLARLSELATGYSVTRSGNQVAGPEEIYSVQGILARTFATRGLREAKARETQYLSSMYKTIDNENRQEAMKLLKNHIRSDTLTPEIVERVAEKYMRTGSPSGWRSAVNTALHDTDSPGVSAVRNHLHPTSPLNSMIDDID